MEKQLNTSEHTKKRPELLQILCILSFIGSGLQIFSSFAFYTMRDLIHEIIKETPQYTTEIQAIFNINPTFFLFNAILFSISFTGVLLMWKLHKVGFHVYSLAQIAILFVVSIYKPFQGFPLGEILITTLFILLYFRHLKFMH